MGRPSKGLQVEWRREIGYARFTHAGRPYLVSTGKRDSGEAHAEAARIYARVTGGEAPRSESTRNFARLSLNELFAEWLASLEGTLDSTTIRTYENTYCGLHWPAHFDSLSAMTDRAHRERYRTGRLRKVAASTVKKECWVQDKFLRWCVTMEVLDESSMPKPLEWDTKTLGTPTKRLKKRNELTPEQVQAVIGRLPEWWENGRRKAVSGKWPIRDRFVFQYETGLRPSTVDELVWGDWHDDSLDIRSEADKARYGRSVPLTEGARAALRRILRGATDRGMATNSGDLVFGRHDYGGSLRTAAREIGLQWLTPYEFRHGRGTHLADAGAPLPAISYLLGHKRVTTTNTYIHPSERSAREALKAVESKFPVHGTQVTGNTEQVATKNQQVTTTRQGVPVQDDVNDPSQNKPDREKITKSRAAGDRAESLDAGRVPETIQAELHAGLADLESVRSGWSAHESAIQALANEESTGTLEVLRHLEDLESGGGS